VTSHFTLHRQRKSCSKTVAQCTQREYYY